jgi:hypothetical protein
MDDEAREKGVGKFIAVSSIEIIAEEHFGDTHTGMK